MQSSIYFFGILVLLLLVTLRGSHPERAIVWVIFLIEVADQYYHRIYGPSDFRYVDYVHLTLDSLAFLMVLWIALGANRFWPLPVCSLHLIGMSGHIAVLSGIPGVIGMHWALLIIPDYLQLPIILVGVIAHARRSSRIGRYRDWRRDWRVPAFLLSRSPNSAPA